MVVLQRGDPNSWVAIEVTNDRIFLKPLAWFGKDQCDSYGWLVWLCVWFVPGKGLSDLRTSRTRLEQASPYPQEPD